MNIKICQTVMCPWVSILPHEEIKKLRRDKDVLLLITLLLKVSQEAIEFYERGKYAHLDAHVGNYGCEVHAFNILSFAYSEELRGECEAWKSTCQKIQDSIDSRRKLKSHEKGDIYQFYIELQGMSMISDRMMYLIQSRLLTLIRDVKHNEKKYDDRKYEWFETEPNKLRNVVPFRGNDTVVNAMISIAQSNMSRSSILFMRAKLNELAIANEREGQLVRRMMSDENLCTYRGKATSCSRTFSCSYYNTKAVLMLLAELNAPLIIKKMTKVGKPVLHFAFKPCGGLGKFEEMTQSEIESCPARRPVIVCVAYLHDQMSIEEWLEKVRLYGLGNMMIANASQESQYVPKRAEVFPIPVAEALEEITFQAEVKAREFECVRGKGIFDPDHFYCSNWEDRGKNIGEQDL